MDACLIITVSQYLSIYLSIYLYMKSLKLSQIFMSPLFSFSFYFTFYFKRPTLRRCLVSVSKQQFSVFKQHFTYFDILFHPHVFLQKFLNDNFQFLNTCTKRALSLSRSPSLICFFLLSFSHASLCSSLKP